MSESLFSVRMRASCRGQHVSGAERIVAKASVGVVADELLSRALVENEACVDEAHCSVERVDLDRVRYEPLPDVTTFEVDGCSSGRLLAARLLGEAGVEQELAAKALQLLAAGAAPGGEVMRGAVVMDVSSGERLEADAARGVRVSRMDLVEAKRAAITRELAENGMGHHRVSEALVLAGKVMHAPGMVAELCWSDAPDYLTGYVCSPGNGYQRISEMKAVGDRKGGRIFFVDLAATGVDDLVEYLERQPVLFTGLGRLSTAEG